MYNYLIYKHEWCKCCFRGTFRKLACGINTLFYKMIANYTYYCNKAQMNYFARGYQKSGTKEAVMLPTKPC